MYSSIRPRIDVLCPKHQERIVVIEPGIDGQPGQGKCLICLTQGATTIDQLEEQFIQTVNNKLQRLDKLHDKSSKRLTVLKKLILTIAEQISQQMNQLHFKVADEIEILTQNVLFEKEKLQNIDISALPYGQLMETLQQIQNDKSDSDILKNIFNENLIKDQIVKAYEELLTFFLDKKQQLHESWPAQGEYKLIFQRDNLQHCNTIATNEELTTLINGLQNDIQVWSIEKDGTLTHQENLKEHTHPVTCLNFSKSNLFASGGQDYMVKIWVLSPTKKWNCIQTLDVHMDRINDIIFSNKGDLLFTASDDKTIRLCKMMNGYAEYEETFSGTFAPIDCLSLSPNNLQLIACDREKNLMLWSRENVNTEWDKKTESLKFDSGNLFTRATFIDDKEIWAFNQDSLLLRFIQNAEGVYTIVSQLALENYEDLSLGFPLTYNSQMKLALCRNGSQQINVLNKQESGIGILQKIHGNFTAGIFSSDGRSIILIEQHYGVVQIWKIEQ